MNDSAKEQTKMSEIRGIIEDIHARSIDIRNKASEITDSPIPDKESDAVVEVATDTVAKELCSSLRKIRSTLREALGTLSAFV